MKHLKHALAALTISAGLVAIGCSSQGTESGAYGSRGAEAQTSGQAGSAEPGNNPPAHPGSEGHGGGLGGSSNGQAGGNGNP